MHFIGKSLHRKLVVRLTKEFNLSKGGRAYDVTDIRDQALRFTIQLLAICMLRKCRPNEVLAATVKLAAQAKEGQTYNWCLYLSNQFMEDYAQVPEYNQSFHYSWLLVLMEFIMWKEPKHS